MAGDRRASATDSGSASHSIAERLDAGMRLEFEDGVRLFACPDLLALGWLANRERERRHGARTYYNFNIRLEATNVCVASCLFCSFARLRPGDPGSYTMSLEQVWDKLRSAPTSPSPKSTSSTACIPTCRSSTTRRCCAASSGSGPTIHLKCFTAVEIAFFADLYGKTDEQVLRELQEAGLDSLPGGGAEMFAERVRRKIAHDKCDADRYLAIHKLAHGLGLRTNITMLYGHIETAEERVDHMLRTRALQDETRRPPGLHPARVPSRQQPDAQAAGAERRRDAARARGVAADARQRAAHQGVLDCNRSRDGAAVALVRRRATSTARCRRSGSTTWPARARRRG